MEDYAHFQDAFLEAAFSSDSLMLASGAEIPHTLMTLLWRLKCYNKVVTGVANKIY